MVLDFLGSGGSTCSTTVYTTSTCTTIVYTGRFQCCRGKYACLTYATRWSLNTALPVQGLIDDDQSSQIHCSMCLAPATLLRSSGARRAITATCHTTMPDLTCMSEISGHMPRSCLKGPSRPPYGCSKASLGGCQNDELLSVH